MSLVYKHLVDTLPGFELDEAAVAAGMQRGVKNGWLVEEEEGGAVHLKNPVQTPERAQVC